VHERAPRTRYARTAEGDYLAYQVVGEGARDLVLVLSGGAPADLVWEEPATATGLQRLASLGRLVLFDPRGFGSSSRVGVRTLPGLQTWMDDIGTVMAAVNSDRATLLSWGAPALFAMLFAATYPERVERLVLINAFARYVRSPDSPWALDESRLEEHTSMIREAWGSGAVAAFLAPNLVRTSEQRRRWARLERLSATPDVGAALPSLVHASDVTSVLPTIQAPTLLVTRDHDAYVPTQHSDYIAQRIGDARVVRLAGPDHLPFAGDTSELLDVIEEFVTGGPAGWVPERVLSTVLFTDIVGSTDQVARLGDAQWRRLLDAYDDTVDLVLSRFRGRRVTSTGDGTLATFDGPARAVQCAQAIHAAVRDLGLQLRAGLHTGEIEIRGDDVAGMAVHLAARVCALAGAGEVLVTRTVTDLVVGSGLAFQEHGRHRLKGIPGQTVLFRVYG
jgi:class 3 adenylate cyclase